MKRTMYRAIHNITSLNSRSHVPVEPQSIVPASSSESMNEFISWIKEYSRLKPKNVIEIGANLGQDAWALKEGFNLPSKDVYAFEPHPQLNQLMRERYDFNSYDYAILDKNGTTKFFSINLEKNSNSGISSARQHVFVPKEDFIEHRVKTVTMEKFMKDQKIKKIDFLKIDVEGCTYEVLKGFGPRLKDINALHIEAEHDESWRGEKLWEDIRAILQQHLEMVYFKRFMSQSDSFWVKKKFLLKERDVKH